MQIYTIEVYERKKDYTMPIILLLVLLLLTNIILLNKEPVYETGFNRTTRQPINFNRTFNSKVPNVRDYGN